ncbi:MAG: hypothetical protein CK530_11295 [Planctomycetaceae bacterium]|nr:MAG: hypothetical protein CK530_11295 [Planctomycetaceae bacterium]
MFHDRDAFASATVIWGLIIRVTCVAAASNSVADRCRENFFLIKSSQKAHQTLMRPAYICVLIFESSDFIFLKGRHPC